MMGIMGFSSDEGYHFGGRVVIRIILFWLYLGSQYRLLCCMLWDPGGVWGCVGFAAISRTWGAACDRQVDP